MNAVTLTTSPADEAVVMIRPPLPPFDMLIRSTAYVTPVVAPIAITFRLASIPAWAELVHSWASECIYHWFVLTLGGTPALLHKISIFPPRTLSASFQASSQFFFEVTSQWTKWTLKRLINSEHIILFVCQISTTHPSLPMPYCFLSSPTVDSPAVVSMSKMHTLAPWLIKRLANSNPRPWEPPVMIALRPLGSKLKYFIVPGNVVQLCTTSCLYRLRPRPLISIRS